MVSAPKPRKILYVAPLKPGNTSVYRLEAFRRIGQEMIPFAVDDYEFSSRYLYALQFRFPVGPLIARINTDLRRAIKEHQPDVVWFDKPTYFNSKTIEIAKRSGATTVCYNQDSPFGPRNDGCWHQFYKVFKLFDLHCLFRTADVPRYAGWGLPFIKVNFSYDPRQQFPPPPGWADKDRTRDLAYNGSPLEERPEFLRRLGDEFHLPVTVAGPRWDRVWPEDLQKKYVVAGMLKDAAYRENIWKSKINLSFVTDMNQDDVAHKSFEITACGQFLLALRSEGHLASFEEGKEAEFYSSIEEAADKARYYLANPEERERIARAGLARSITSGYDNDSQLSRVLWRLDGQEY